MKPRLALKVPGTETENGYFSLRLKKELRNERSVFRDTGKTLVISNIEGDFKSFRKLLVVAGVMNKKFQWTFEDGHLVILGDCLKQGKQVIECLWLIYGLEEKAVKHGGWVHFILGNRDVVNMNGDWRFMQPQYATNIRKGINRYAVLFDGNNELWRWLKTKNIMEIIGKRLFVHGGISCEVNQLSLSVDDINKIARPFYTQPNSYLEHTASIVLFNTETSPLSYQGYYTQDADAEQINKTLEKFEVETIITGHTITDQIKLWFNGKVINVNTDCSSGTSQALLIREELLFCIDENGKTSNIKE